MLDPAEVTRKLPVMSWRGIKLAITDREHVFAHESAPHHIIFRDGVTTEMMGAQGRTFIYTANFSENIQTAIFKNLFTSVLYKFYEAYRDPTPGPLVDPVHGEITCTPGSWDETQTAMRTDGVMVRLAFTEYTPLGQQIQDSPPTIEGVYDSARRLDEEVARAPWDVEQPSPQPTTDPLSAFAGVLNQVNVARDRADATVMSVADKAHKVERAAERLGLAGEPARKAARKLRLDCERLAKAPPRDKAGVLVETTVKAPMTIAQLAAQSGMDIIEFIRNNPGLGRTPFVSPGTKIFTR